MGLLDDAIREHLDLKRRHGADPAEVERLEREALGPVRRGPEETDPLEAHAGADVDYYEDAEPRGSHGYQSEPRAGDDEFDDSERPLPEYEGDLPEHESTLSDAPAAAGEPSGDLAARAIPPPHPAHATSKPQPSLEPLSQETAEFDVDRALAAEPAEKDEDVLEETPEFLQDAPDRDRLWFEQRPPRDFDFDG